MGRQIAVATAPADEELLLAFLRQTADIALIESFAKTKQGLWQDALAKDMTGHWSYSIWNKAFPWTPRYGRTHNPQQPERHGLYYIANTYDAPIIEFTRSEVSSKKFGRIYWSKDFAAPEGLHYDVDEFTKWYEGIMRWIKKSATGKIKDGRITYLLPNAWHIYSKISENK